MSDDYEMQAHRDAPDPAILGERADRPLGKAETVTPEVEPAKVTRAVRKRGASQAPTGGVYVVYDSEAAVQVYSSEIAALRYASERGFKVRKVAYGADL